MASTQHGDDESGDVGRSREYTFNPGSLDGLRLKVWDVPSAEGLLRARLDGRTNVRCAFDRGHEADIEIEVAGHPQNADSATLEAALDGDEVAAQDVAEELLGFALEEWVDPCEGEIGFADDVEMLNEPPEAETDRRQGASDADILVRHESEVSVLWPESEEGDVWLEERLWGAFLEWRHGGYVVEREAADEILAEAQAYGLTVKPQRRGRLRLALSDLRRWWEERGLC